MTDPRIKEVEIAPGVKFDMGMGKTLRTMAGSGGIVVFDDQTDVENRFEMEFQMAQPDSASVVGSVGFIAQWLPIHHRVNSRRGEPAFRHVPVHLRARSTEDDKDFLGAATLDGTSGIHRGIATGEDGDAIRNGGRG